MRIKRSCGRDVADWRGLVVKERVMKYSISMISALFLLHFLSGNSYAAIGSGYDWISNNKEELFDYTKYGVDPNWETWNTDDKNPDCPSGKGASLDGMIKIFPFKNLGKNENDTIVVYAIPRDNEGKKKLKDRKIKVWSDTFWNQQHINHHSGLDGHYDCSTDSNLCYIALRSKDGGLYNVEDVYLIFPEEITDQWKNPYEEEQTDLSEMEQAFEDACNQRYGGENCSDLGKSVSDIHCWDRNNATCDNDVWIRDYKDDSTGKETALIYNPNENDAYLMSEVFWAYYKMIGGNKVLGAPKNNATCDPDRCSQKFEKGKLVWSTTPPEEEYSFDDWQITEYDKDGIAVDRNGNSGGTDPGNGNGDGPPVIENPWIGYKSRAGIRYVRASKEGKKRWKNKLEVSLLDIYDMDFRANLKQKGGVWPEDTAASFYLSEDDVLDSGDILLGTADRDLTRYQDRKKKSIYLEDIDMADYIDRPGD